MLALAALCRTMQKSGTMSRDRSTTKIAFAEDVKVCGQCRMSSATFMFLLLVIQSHLISPPQAADESRQGTARVLSASPSALSRTGACVCVRECVFSSQKIMTLQSTLHTPHRFIWRRVAI